MANTPRSLPRAIQDYVSCVHKDVEEIKSQSASAVGNVVRDFDVDSFHLRFQDVASDQSSMEHVYLIRDQDSEFHKELDDDAFRLLTKHKGGLSSGNASPSDQPSPSSPKVITGDLLNAVSRQTHDSTHPTPQEGDDGEGDEERSQEEGEEQEDEEEEQDDAPGRNPDD